jgi:hypothetical protein
LHLIKKFENYHYDKYWEEQTTSDYEYAQWKLKQLDKEKLKDEQKQSFLLRKLKDKALSEIEKTIDVASFIINKDALTELIRLKEEYMRGFDDEEDYGMCLEKSCKLIDGYLERIKTIAKNDLETVIDKFSDWLKNCKYC